MFWKKKTPAWLSELENMGWVVNRIHDLILFYGDEQFNRRAPIIVQGDYTQHLPDAPEEFLRAVCLEMIEQARIPVEDVRVQLYSEDSVYDILGDMGIPYSHEGDSGTAGCFHTIDAFGVAQIAIEADQLNDHLSLMGTLAHELAHVFLHRQRPDDSNELWPEDEEEVVTDLVAVLLGFGIFACNSAERFVKHSDGFLESWSTTVQGYLGLEEICVAQALVDRIFEQNFRDYRALIAGNPRKLLAEALPFVEQLLIAPDEDEA